MRRMATHQIAIRGVSEELAARLDAFADANAFGSRSGAAKFLLNKALIAEGFGAAVTPETVKAAGA
jgi:hypothetical protein